MNILKRIFSAPEVIRESMDMARDGIDALVFTDQEKADRASAATERAQLLFMEWLDKSQGQNLARRFLAVYVSIIWGFMYIASWIMQTVAVFLPAAQAQSMISASKFAQESAFEMSGAFMLVLTFYFAAPHVGQAVNVLADRLGSKHTTPTQQTPPGG